MAVRVRRDKAGVALLTYRREYLGVSQDHIATIARKTRPWVGQLESGTLRTCDEVTAARIARFLSTTAEALFEQLPFPRADGDPRPAEPQDVRRAG